MQGERQLREIICLPMTAAPIKLHPRAIRQPCSRARLKREIARRGAVRRLLARALLAPTRRSTRSSRSAWWCRRTEEATRIALQIAREEGVPVLPRGGGTSQCGQTVGAALVIDNQQASEPGRRVRRARRATVVRAARRRARPAQRVAEAARAVVSGRRLDQRAGDDRRHGRQQLLRLALDPLRQHGAQRARRSTRVLADGDEFEFGAVPDDLARCDGSAGYRELVEKMRAIAAREADEIEARFPQGAAPRRRLQHRHGAAAPAIQHGASAGRLGGHARLFEAPASEALAAAEAQGARHLPLPDLLPGDGSAAAHRQAGPGRGRTGRPHDDRARARQPGVPRRSWTGSSRASPTRSCWSSSPATTSDEQLRQARSSSSS